MIYEYNTSKGRGKKPWRVIINDNDNSAEVFETMLDLILEIYVENRLKDVEY